MSNRVEIWNARAGGLKRRSRTDPAAGADPAFIAGWGNGGLPVYRNEFTTLTDLNIRNDFLTFDEARAEASQVSVVNDQLVLRAEWLNPVESAGPRGTLTHNTGYVDWRSLSDAANPTPVHFSQLWGMWVWRAQPCSGLNARGSLSALWLRCDSGNGVLGEIDVMEAYGYGGQMGGSAGNNTTFNNFVKDSATTTFHSNTNSAATNGKPYRKTFWRHFEHGVPKQPWAGMRTYAFERMPTYMRLTVDDVEVFNVTPSSTDPVNGVGSSVNPSGTLAWLWDTDFFGNPLHVRINLHVGPSATSWGDADPNNKALSADPMDFKIEYLRIYAPAS